MVVELVASQVHVARRDWGTGESREVGVWEGSLSVCLSGPGKQRKHMRFADIALYCPPPPSHGDLEMLSCCRLPVCSVAKLSPDSL